MDSPTWPASSVSDGFTIATPSAATTSGICARVDLGGLEQLLALRRVGAVPAVGHLVAGEELAHLRRARRPAVPDDLRLEHRAVVGGVPRVELGVDDRVELLLRRVPRLEQVVVEVDDVDGLDGGVGVGVGGQQHPARAGVEVHRGLEEVQPVHARHAVVGEQHRHGVAAQLHLAQRVQGLLARFGADDAVRVAVAPAQVARDGARDTGVVVDGQDRGAAGFRHTEPS